MKNECIFSKDRLYRYSLLHRWDEGGRLIGFIGLNPSIADETKLDRTLTRIKGFSQKAGFSGFYMLNLFAFITSYPKIMKEQGINAVGILNDHYIDLAFNRVDMMVACWGTMGNFLGRDKQVIEKIKDKMFYLDLNKDGSPKHPLYLKGDLTFKKY